MSSSDIEMVDSSHSESELPQQLVEVDVTVAAAYKPGPQRLTYKGKQYIWKHHEDNCRAFTKPSVIWQLGDEYRRTGSDQETRYWPLRALQNDHIVSNDRRDVRRMRESV